MNNTGLLQAQERPQETGIERHWREEAEREANAPQVTPDPKKPVSSEKRKR